MECCPRTARRRWRRHCPVTPQCAFISIAATDAGRGRQTLLVGGKAAVAVFSGRHTPRIILSARSSRKPVVEDDHANDKARQSHCLNSPTRHVSKNISLYNAINPKTQRRSAGINL